MFIFNFKICRSIVMPLDQIISVLFKVSLNDHSILAKDGFCAFTLNSHVWFCSFCSIVFLALAL